MWCALFSHVIRGVESPMLEVNYIVSSLLGHVRTPGLDCFSIWQFGEQSDFLTRCMVTLQGPLLVWERFTWSGPCNLCSILSLSWVCLTLGKFKRSESGSLPEDVSCRWAREMLLSNSEERRFFQWDIFLSGPIWSSAVKSFIHYHLISSTD